MCSGGVTYLHRDSDVSSGGVTCAPGEWYLLQDGAPAEGPVHRDGHVCTGRVHQNSAPEH